MGGVFDIAGDLLTARVRCAAAAQLHKLAQDGMVRLWTSETRAERKRRCDELDKLKTRGGSMLTSLDEGNLADSTVSPGARLWNDFMNRKGGPDTIFARSDGFSQISMGWLGRASLLLVVLTILAIALYLFGQAYTMGPTTAGRWLIGSGVTLVGISVAIGVYAWVKPVFAVPHEPPAAWWQRQYVQWMRPELWSE